jgi:hypothetical protein
MITNNVISLAEQAISSLLITNLKSTVAKDQVYISDNDEIKQPMPYVIVHAESAEEQVTPGCGLYLVSIKVMFRSHVKETSTDQRTDVVNALNNMAYTTPASALSAIAGFHCHGFVPASGSMTVDGETKSYVYEIKYSLYCMPSDN